MSFARTSFAKISIPLVFAAFALASCAQDKQESFPTTNPFQKKCEAKGVAAGSDAMVTCIRHEGALSMGSETCSRKGMKAGTPKGDACIKTESDYVEAESACQAAGRVSSQADYDACVAERAPEAAAIKEGKRKS
ncbi:hypothetical protein [Labrys miyagiensis]|nr:hypothetical protein [Labrys miyagiensis]